MFVLEFERGLLPLNEPRPLEGLFQLQPEKKARDGWFPMFSSWP